MVRKHLVALDGKFHAERAFDWYLENFYRDGDEVVIFHCSQFELHVGLPGMAVNVEAVSKQVTQAKDKAEAITQKATETLRLKGIKGYVVLKSGSKPEDLINQVVDEENVNHVFMGTRDLGSIQRAFVGSVSTAVARSCKVPVTIVKIKE
ncbi:uncharacterized protein LOC101854968 [Aplysia californica]|uniref:Uncharacterized protein LOC101854968 n=1 Tax=Aplysia californica TaxID=6500 RepID=A0ABM0JXM3_APLCA|nr:uncharacterized protein LOC101854968 [Aplysia californica]XP_005103938.1 uncharacterized protein LOC101854968 [Aplysia californica]